ncbi:MAG: hypothetical protein ACNA8K_13035, partial [Cyclonatronaceae bacterium]
MKKLFITIIISMAIQFYGSQVISQITESFICGTPENYQEGIGLGLLSSSPGFKVKSVHQTGEYYRMLFVFVEFPGDTLVVSDWPSGQPPTYMDAFIDSVKTSNPTPGSLTHYFEEMSISNFNVIGKSIYIIAPQSSEYYANLNTTPDGRRWALYEDIINEIDQIVDLSTYANWNGHTFAPGNATSVDMIGIIHRYFNPDHRSAIELKVSGKLFDGAAYLGDGTSVSVANGSTLVQRGSYGSGFILTRGGSRNVVFRDSIHEFGHYLFGGNQYHIKRGTWGIMAGYGSRSSAVNPYERQRLGWIDPNAHEIGDLDKNISIGDYVTTGDVIKVKIPSSITERFYYLVNHQKDSVFDTPDKTGGKGLYVLEHRDNFPNTLYPIMHAADGRWNWSVPEKAPNPWDGVELPVFKREGPKPTSEGFFDVDRITYNWNGSQESGYIYGYKDPDTNENIWGAHFRGDGKDAFNIGGNAFFGPWSNPRPLTPNDDVFSFAFHIENEVNGVMDVRLYLSDYAPTNITVDAVWHGEILLTENVSVSSTATLTILPGTNVSMDPGVSLTIDGTLLAIGTQSDPIRFQAGGSSRWDMVRLTGSSSNSDIRWAVFEGGQYGLSGSGSGHQIRNSAFRNNNFGLWLSS